MKRWTNEHKTNEIVFCLSPSKRTNTPTNFNSNFEYFHFIYDKFHICFAGGSSFCLVFFFCLLLWLDWIHCCCHENVFVSFTICNIFKQNRKPLKSVRSNCRFVSILKSKHVQSFRFEPKGAEHYTLHRYYGYGMQLINNKDFFLVELSKLQNLFCLEKCCCLKSTRKKEIKWRSLGEEVCSATWVAHV